MATGDAPVLEALIEINAASLARTELDDRSLMLVRLAALAAVDAVVLFEEDTPLELIRALRPNVLVKGGDYTVETVVGHEDVIA